MSDQTTAPVLLDVDDGVARLRLNRPEASNALNLPLLKALLDAIMRCHGDPGVRALLLSGEGANFCGGGDVRDFAAKGERLPDYLREATAYLQASAAGLIQLQAPVVTVVQGWATGGGGFGLVCASDLVLAAESARFMLGETCLPEEARTVSDLSGTADAREGLAAVIERRAPRFTGR